MPQRPVFFTIQQYLQDRSVSLGFELDSMSSRFQIWYRPKADGCTPEEEIAYTLNISTLEADFMTYEVRP